MPFQANTFANWVNVNLDEINSECKRVGKTGQQGCNSIDIMNFGDETGRQNGPHSGPNSVL